MEKVAKFAPEGKKSLYNKTQRLTVDKDRPDLQSIRKGTAKPSLNPAAKGQNQAAHPESAIPG